MPELVPIDDLPVTISKSNIVPDNDLPENIKPSKAHPAFKALDFAVGIPETALSLITGAGAGLTGIAGEIGAMALGKGDETAKEFKEFVSDYYTYKPRYSKMAQETMGTMGELGKVLSIPRNVAEKYLGEKAGVVTDVAMLGLGAKAPAIGKAIAKAPVKAGEFLYRKTLQPTGTVAETEAMTRTGFQGKFWLNEKGIADFKKVKGAFDRTLNQVIASGEGKTIPLNKITGALDDLADKYGGYTMKPLTDRKAIGLMKKQIETEWLEKYPDGNIPIAEIQKFKQTQYLRQKSSYGEVKKAMETESAKALARVSKNELEQILPDLAKVNPYEKNLIQFYDEFDKAIVRAKNERFTMTNLTLDNKYLLTKLAQVFRKMSPDHIFANPNKLRAYLKDIPSPTVGEVMDNAKSDFTKKQIAYDKNRVINMGMEDVSGQPTGYTPPLVEPTTKAITHQPDYKSMGMMDESTVKAIKGEFNNPAFWNANKDLTALRLKLKNKQPISEPEMNTLLYRIMQKLPAKKDWYSRKTPPLKGSRTNP